MSSCRSLPALLVLFTLSLCIIAPHARAADALEGKWKIKVDPDEDARKAGQKEFDDVLVFKGNKFVSETLKKKGFNEADYEEDTRRFGPAVFKAEPKSETEGTAKWSGTVTATEIKGELIWIKKDGTELRFAYVGSKS